MSWARPHCTTRRAAQRWMVRVCSLASRNSMKWSWRGRRCCGTARRRDEGGRVVSSDVGDRGYFLSLCLCEKMQLLGVKPREGWQSFRRVVLFPTCFTLWSLHPLSTPSFICLDRPASFGIVWCSQALFPLLTSHPEMSMVEAHAAPEGTKESNPVQYMMNTKPTIEGYFLPLFVVCSSNRNLQVVSA